MAARHARVSSRGRKARRAVRAEHDGDAMASIRAARLDASPRLQRVAELLADGRWYSTLDIMIGAGVCAVNSCVSELRANGLTIECRRVGRERFEYRLTGGIPRPVHATAHA